MAESSVAFQVFDTHRGSWRPFRGDLPGQLRLLASQPSSAGTGDTAGAGYVRIDRSCALSLAPDSDLYVHVISGEIRIGETPTSQKAAHAGDAVTCAKGATLAIDVVGHCHLFYVAASSPDWRDRLRLRG